MPKLIFLIIAVAFLNLTAFGQTEKYTTPIKWERYKNSEKEVSILLPKLPVFQQYYSPCDEKESFHYAVYAEDVVYQLRIISKSKRKIPDTCDVKNKFGRETLEKRLNELKTLSIIGSEKNYKQESREVTEFKEKITKHWIFDDLKNDKWVEIAMTHREDVKPDAKRFTESLKFEKNSSGKEIGEGATATFGDESAKQENSGDSTNAKDENLYIVSKFRPNYTDAARSNNVQGSVTLRVTFYANGAIGAVTPVNYLPFGLTEQAIAAAKKITFLPASRKGKKVAMTKTVQYTFTIY